MLEMDDLLSCAKEPIETEKGALRAAAKQYLSGRSFMRPYFCSACSAWHLTGSKIRAKDKKKVKAQLNGIRHRRRNRFQPRAKQAPEVTSELNSQQGVATTE